MTLTLHSVSLRMTPKTEEEFVQKASKFKPTPILTIITYFLPNQYIQTNTYATTPTTSPYSRSNRLF